MKTDNYIYRQMHEAALPLLPAIVRRILPNGKTAGHEYTAINPRRADTGLGSFKVNLLTGRWADFAVGASGGDITSLIAYVQAISQSEAVGLLAGMIGRTL